MVDFLKKGLLKSGWKQSAICECSFSKQGAMLLVHFGDAILILPNEQRINAKIRSIQ
jgi:hypothetical protein